MLFLVLYQAQKNKEHSTNLKNILIAKNKFLTLLLLKRKIAFKFFSNGDQRYNCLVHHEISRGLLHLPPFISHNPP